MILYAYQGRFSASKRFIKAPHSSSPCCASTCRGALGVGASAVSVPVSGASPGRAMP